MKTTFTLPYPVLAKGIGADRIEVPDQLTFVLHQFDAEAEEALVLINPDIQSYQDTKPMRVQFGESRSTKLEYRRTSETQELRIRLGSSLHSAPMDAGIVYEIKLDDVKPKTENGVLVWHCTFTVSWTPKTSVPQAP